ncbi:MAG: hypothetical protein IRY98_09975, partial [Alicyclobacillaceae bacterium]|nr:hypothetical protein [Alicyclobacillaceae bacterium]
YVLPERLYYHHAKIISSAMVARMVEWAREEGQLTEGELLRCDDAGVLERLRRAAEKDRRIMKMLDLLGRRALFKRGVEVYAGEVGDERRVRWVALWRNPEARRAMERWIARRLGCPEDEVILYCQAETFMKEVEALCLTVDGLKPLGLASLSTELEVRLLEQKYRDLWRLYVLVPESRREGCRILKEEILEALDASPEQL